MNAKARRPVCRCVMCQVTFLRVEDYLNPRHLCVMRRHPSAQPATTQPVA